MRISSLFISLLMLFLLTITNISSTSCSTGLPTLSILVCLYYDAVHFYLQEHQDIPFARHNQDYIISIIKAFNALFVISTCLFADFP